MLERTLAQRHAPPESRLERLCVVGEMAGSLIHRFNNTLSVVLCHVDLLLETVEDEEQRGRLEVLSQAASDSAKLARAFQELLRDGSVDQEEFDVNALVADALRMAEPLWLSGSRQRSGRIEATTELATVPRTVGSPARIREALVNLIINAVDAMPRGGRLELHTRSRGDDIHVEVEDTGIGMSESVRTRIFEPFFTTKGECGNGLGLRIVQRVAQEHGGSVRVMSAPGLGSRFTLVLPVRQPARSSERSCASPQTRGANVTLNAD